MKLTQTLLIVVACMATGAVFAQDGNAHGPPNVVNKQANTVAPKAAKPAPAPAKVPAAPKTARPSH